MPKHVVPQRSSASETWSRPNHQDVQEFWPAMGRATASTASTQRAVSDVSPASARSGAV